jgi:dihydrofolate reductase
MRWFRQVTAGSTVIMGRRTWESIPRKFRPLAGRRNIVLTSYPDYQPDPAAREWTTASGGGRSEAVAVCHNLDHALSLKSPYGQYFVIGGQDLYRQALPLADRVYLTIVPRECLDMDKLGEDDRSIRTFPELGEVWQTVSSFSEFVDPDGVPDQPRLYFQVLER